MPVPPLVSELVERFTLHGDEYRTGRFNETQLRRDFLDPFFDALGWDVSNKAGYAEAYRDVIHEDAIKVGGATKAPDYCFRVGGTRKFFVEAKKPGVNLKTDPLPAYQLRRYGWSAKLPLCILTDFEEFAVYDCRKKPDAGDKASVARTLYLNYTHFADRWDEIAGVFSREAVLKGSFDKYADSSKKKRGTAEVDDAFLAEIEGWRELLAKNIALRNDLGARDLNYAVQKTIDRLVFLRICEDRGIEDYGRLQALQNGQKVYARLTQLFEAADDRYNSGLFHFHKEKNRAEPPDEWTLSLAIDDKPLKEILKHLYYPDSPYEFSVLPADILGQVYERFLGKVIRLTAGGSAKVEEKPEVRKAGGVYYTPTYIVDYIVENTVGKLLDGAKVVQAERRDRRLDRTLRVLDPACGSGSFLLGAYQYLLDWHLKWYLGHEPEKLAATASPPVHFDAKLKDWRLTTAERKRILLDHIYGVDIDAQAVEVTKLSLLLKVLEGETRETLQRQLFAKERALPDLAENIKCGNSLIGPDFYAATDPTLFDDEERLRINVFDWKTEFREAMKAGGFDAVIGNPPYVRIQTMTEKSPLEVNYTKRKYHSASKGNFDIYVAFVERGESLLSALGRLGFILPSKFLTTDYGAPLRECISAARSLDRIVDFAHHQVFAGATTYTCLLFLHKNRQLAANYTSAKAGHGFADRLQWTNFPLASLSSAPWEFSNRETKDLIDKLSAGNPTLLELPAAMSRGTSSGADNIFCLQEHDGILTSRDGEIVDVERELLRQPIYATDFNRYRCAINNNERIIFPYEVTENGYSIIPEAELRRRYPKAYEYLRVNRQSLEQRKQWKEWYGFSAPRNLNVHEHADLLVPLLANRGLFAPMPLNRDGYCLMASGGFSISIRDQATQPLYVLALINSRLLFWRLRQSSNTFRGGWITCTKQYFGKLPICLPSGTGGKRGGGGATREVSQQGNRNVAFYW